MKVVVTSRESSLGSEVDPRFGRAPQFVLVDAVDLHLVMAPDVLERADFVSGHDAMIVEERRDGCDECVAACRFDAITRSHGAAIPTVDPVACEGCGVCRHVCPARGEASMRRHSRGTPRSATVP